MPLDRRMLFYVLFKVIVIAQADRHWIVSKLVRVEDHSVNIGMHDDANLVEAASNVTPSIYLSLEALILLDNAVDEARQLVETQDIDAGGVRLHIGIIKVIKEEFEAAVEQAFNI